MNVNECNTIIIGPNVVHNLVELIVFLFYLRDKQKFVFGCWWVLDLHLFEVYLSQQLISPMPKEQEQAWMF